MGASAVLRTTDLSVEPGGRATCDVAVKNTGSIVDEYTFEVLGDAAAWASVVPDRLSLFPAAEGSAQLVFEPLRTSSTPAGAVPFGLKVASKEDPQGSVVVEGTLVVAPFDEVTAEITPRTSRGSLSGRHQLAVDNRGNVGLNATITAGDPDEQLRFDIKPPAISPAPGTAEIATVRARPRKRFLRGQPQTRPFQVSVEAEGVPPTTVEGTYLQEALIPKWLPRALALLAALALLWVFVLRPTVESLAKEATKDVLTDFNKRLGKVEQGAGAGAGGAPGGGVATPPSQTTNKVTIATATDGRLTGAVGKGAERGFDGPPLAAKTTLSITDVFFENPQADSGRIQLKRGNAVLLDIRLDNFRDLDYHFVTALVFSGNQRVRLVIRCDAPGTGFQTCAPALYFTGFITKQL